MTSVCSNAIDWVATGAMLQGIGTLAGVGAVVFGASAWKKQKQAERRLEMAERILAATYNARTALRYIRAPLMWGHELSVAEDTLKADERWDRKTDAERKRLTKAQAYFNRLNKTKDEQIALDQCLPMSRALFGETLENAVENLRRQFWIVQVDVESYIDDEHGTDRDFSRKIYLSMYDVKGREGERSEVSEAIANSVDLIERTCLPALRLEPVKPVKPAKSVPA